MAFYNRRSTRIGNAAECATALWASFAGLTINPAKNDNKGWDFFVEFEELQRRATDDLQIGSLKLPAPKCLIQVKATDDRRKKFQVKLDSLVQLATGFLPSFFLFLELDGRSSPQRAYLLHVDERLSDRVLARFRSLSAEDRVKANQPGGAGANYRLLHRAKVARGRPATGRAVRSHGLPGPGHCWHSYVLEGRSL